LGVTILAVLQILIAILLLFGALAFFALAALTSVTELQDQLGTELPQWLLDTAATVFAVLGVILLLFAILWFAIAYGFFKGRGWAWTAAIVLAILSIMLDVLPAILVASVELLLDAGTLISIAILLLIILYLTRPHVKRFFGKEAPQPGGSLPPMMH